MVCSCVIAATTYHRSFHILFGIFDGNGLTHAVAPTRIQHVVVRLNTVSGKIFIWTYLHKSCGFLFVSKQRILRDKTSDMNGRHRVRPRWQLTTHHKTTLADRGFHLCALSKRYFLFIFFQNYWGDWSPFSPPCFAIPVFIIHLANLKSVEIVQKSVKSQGIFQLLMIGNPDFGD